jgi:hypothetical protein
MIKMMIAIMTGMMVMMMKMKKAANFAIMPKIIFPTITMMIGITGMMIMIMIAYEVTNFVTMVVVIAAPMLMVIITSTSSSSSRNGAPRCELPYCQQVRIGYGLRRVVAYN